MVIFNSYVKLPEGRTREIVEDHDLGEDFEASISDGSTRPPDTVP